MQQTQYTTPCGCKYSSDNPYPWYVCHEHFAKGYRVQKQPTNLGKDNDLNKHLLNNPLTKDTVLTTSINIAENDHVTQYWLYALRLKDDKYYVGMTAKKNPLYRIKAHGGFLGARWTMLHKPTQILEIRNVGLMTKLQAEDLEHQLTLKYMDIYGYRNVRGGKLTTTGMIVKIGGKYITGYQIETFTVGFMLALLSLVVIYYWAITK